MIDAHQHNLPALPVDDPKFHLAVVGIIHKHYTDVLVADVGLLQVPLASERLLRKNVDERFGRRSMSESRIERPEMQT